MNEINLNWEIYVTKHPYNLQKFQQSVKRNVKIEQYNFFGHFPRKTSYKYMPKE